jgi:hypothetical protein
MKTITATSLAAALPSCHAIAASRNRPQSERYELIDTVLIGQGWAEDIGAEASPLHAQIAQLIADKAAADEAARIAAEAEALANPPPWRVSKDTLISRVLAAGKLPEVMAALASQTAEQQFVFEHSAWFWSTNPTLRGLCTALGMDPDAILARDEFLF